MTTTQTALIQTHCPMRLRIEMLQLKHNSIQVFGLKDNLTVLDIPILKILNTYEMWKIKKLITQKLSLKESERDENKLLFKPICTTVIQKPISLSR